MISPRIKKWTIILLAIFLAIDAIYSYYFRSWDEIGRRGILAIAGFISGLILSWAKDIGRKD